MNILKLFEERDQLNQAIKDQLDIETYQPIELMEDSFWRYDEEDVYWGDSPSEVETYANSIRNRRAIVFHDDVTAFPVRGYNGDEFWQVFRNSKRVD